MKRFYNNAAVDGADNGFKVLLDDRPIKAPSRAPLILPTGPLAEAVAKEWNAQGDQIDPESMHQTKLANTAQDRVVLHFETVANEVSGFAAADLICYRADHPSDLVARQAKTWEPYIVWAKNELDARLRVTSGIMPVEQPKETLRAFDKAVKACTPHELTGLHGAVTAFGSLTIGLAHFRGFVGFEEAWQASIVDEMHQEDLWGPDDEALTRRANLRRDAEAASQFLEYLSVS